MMNPTEFIKRIDGELPNGLERACAILWWVGRDDPLQGLTAPEICHLVEQIGHPQQNASRLNAQLATDARTSRVPGSKSWRLRPRARAALDEKYGQHVQRRPTPPQTDSVLPRELFSNSRKYLERVVHQINASYDAELYDCCAVMCRRLLETLIIEVYEHAKRAADIKGKDGHFLMFADLQRVFAADAGFNVGRNTKKGLDDFKKLGDASAHNRRFNAHKDDIDRIRDGMRLAAEELLHLANLYSGPTP